MKRAWPLLILLLLAGCQGSGTPSERATPEPEATYTLTDYRPSKVASAIALRYHDKDVHVGDNAEDTYARLLGDRTGGFTSELLPQGLKSPYAAHIWQGADDAFGIISYEGKVAVAMVQEMRTNQEHANNVRDAHQKLVGIEQQPQIISGDKVTYYFWTRDLSDEVGGSHTQRLMIMIFQNRDSVFLTVAMGDGKVMDVLGMSPDQAEKDQIASDEILRGQEAGANADKK
jgi:hypothetical protein